MTENERKSMMILADTINGEINRMCVTKELTELDTMYGHAKRNLDKLSKMIYDDRFKAERGNKRGDYIYPTDTVLETPNTATSMPCEDAISRKAVLDGIEELKQSPWFNDDTNGAKIIRKEAVEIVEELCVKRLPSVTPQPKTGHWITTRTFMHDGEFYCDKCKCDAPNNEKWDYCPNCGAKMVEPQESEDK